MKVRIKFRKYGVLKFIGHLDVMRFFQKAMRRAEIPIAFTGGYSPHMIMSFASPLGIGLISDGEYVDIELAEPISSGEALERMNAVMVEGMEIISFRQISEEKKATGMAIVAAADYLVKVQKGCLPVNWKELFAAFYAQPEIRIIKQTKRSQQEVDIRPMIYEAEIRENELFLKLASGSVQNLKPDLVMEAFLRYARIEKEELAFSFHRLEMYAYAGSEKEQAFVTLESLGNEIM